MRSSLLALFVWIAACSGAGCSSGTAPPIYLSVTLADGRSCADSSVLAISVERGSDDPSHYLCTDVLAPGRIGVGGLPLFDAVVIAGVSVEGTELYRGSLLVSSLPNEVLSSAEPATTVSLFPYAVR